MQCCAYGQRTPEAGKSPATSCGDCGNRPNGIGRIKSAACAATVLQPNLWPASKASKMPRWMSYACGFKPATGSPTQIWWLGMFCSALASDRRSCNFSACCSRTANWFARCCAKRHQSKERKDFASLALHHRSHGHMTATTSTRDGRGMEYLMP